MHKKSKSSRAAQAAQAEILAAIQRTGNNVAEVMNSLQALGAKFGINVNFTLGGLKSGANRARVKYHAEEHHAEHSEPYISKIPQGKKCKAQEVTIPELAAMISDELGMNEDCALDALETAFELMERYSLILDIGDIGILAGHEVQEVREPFADCEDFEDCCEDCCEDCSEDCCEDCEACGNFNHCDYFSENGDGEEDEDDEDDNSYDSYDNDEE